MDSQDSFVAPAGSSSGPSLLGHATEVIVGAPSTFNNASSIHTVHNVYQIDRQATPESVSGQRRTAPQSIPEIRREHPSQRYARLMEVKGRGLALWNPEPPNGLPDEYKVEGVSIGDVGIVHLNGFFDFLFNICRSSDDPINGGIVPEGFQPLQLSQDSRNFLENGTISEPGSYEATGNISVLQNTPESGYYSFQCCTPGEGAALVLPRGASNKDLLATAQFRRYAANNAISWYEFTHNKLESEVWNGSIYLVTGYDKTSACGTSCFKDDGLPFDLTFEALRWRSTGLASTKAFPSSGYTGSLKNQSVFLRGFTVTLGETTLERIMGSVHVRAGIPSSVGQTNMQGSSFELLDNSSWMVNTLVWITARWRKPSTSSSEQSEVLLPDKPVDDINVQSTPLQHTSPSSLLNNLILQKFHGYEIALTHDDTWRDLLQISTSGTNNEDIVKTLKDSFHIFTEDGAASIDKLSEPHRDPEGALSEAHDVIPVQSSQSGIPAPGVIDEGSLQMRKPIPSDATALPDRDYFTLVTDRYRESYGKELVWSFSPTDSENGIPWPVTLYVGVKEIARYDGASTRQQAKQRAAREAYREIFGSDARF